MHELLGKVVGIGDGKVTVYGKVTARCEYIDGGVHLQVLVNDAHGGSRSEWYPQTVVELPVVNTGG